MKGNAIARIVIYSILILFLVSILLLGMGMDAFLFQTDSGMTEITTNEATFNSSDITKLAIEWAAGNIKIKTSDVDTITVLEEGQFSDRYNMVCTASEGTLHIQYSKGNIMIGFHDIPSKNLTVLVPHTWDCQELELDCAAVEVSVTGLTVESVKLDGAALELDYNGFFKKMECDGAACKLRIVTTGKPDRLEIEGAACEVSLSLPDDCGYYVDADGLADVHAMRGSCDANGNYSYLDAHFQISLDGVGCSLSIH